MHKQSATSEHPETLIRAALDCRASTAKKTQTTEGEDYRQRPEIQEEQLRRACDQRGWTVVAVYCDRTPRACSAH